MYLHAATSCFVLFFCAEANLKEALVFFFFFALIWCELFSTVVILGKTTEISGDP